LFYCLPQVIVLGRCWLFRLSGSVIIFFARFACIFFILFSSSSIFRISMFFLILGAVTLARFRRMGVTMAFKFFLLFSIFLGMFFWYWCSRLLFARFINPPGTRLTGVGCP